MPLDKQVFFHISKMMQELVNKYQLNKFAGHMQKIN